MPDETGVERSGLDLYFLDRVGGNFKATIFYEPYFYLDLGSSWNRAVEVIFDIIETKNAMLLHLLLSG